jgi:hypothetical protein
MKKSLKYLNIILTVIAVLLAAYFFKPLLFSCTYAQSGAQEVNIVAVGGKTITYGGSVPVTNR